MCKKLEQIAAEKIRAFLEDYVPYEADCMVAEWIATLEEEPEQLMELIESYDVEIGQFHELYDAYNAMYDAVYEVCLCHE